MVTASPAGLGEVPRRNDHGVSAFTRTPVLWKHGLGERRLTERRQTRLGAEEHRGGTAWSRGEVIVAALLFPIKTMARVSAVRSSSERGVGALGADRVGDKEDVHAGSSDGMNVLMVMTDVVTMVSSAAWPRSHGKEDRRHAMLPGEGRHSGDEEVDTVARWSEALWPSRR